MEYSKTRRPKERFARLKQKGKALVLAIAVSTATMVSLTACDIEFVVEDNELVVSFLDVGQGDSILIQSDECNVLIDGGEKGNAEYIEQYLSEHNVETLDYVIGTHPHADHIGSLPTIINDCNVENVILPKTDDSDTPTTKIYESLLTAISDKGLTITPATVGTTYDLGNATLEVLAPNSDDYSDLNDYSVVTLLTHGDNTFLLTGDASDNSESEMLENGLLEDVDLLKVGHHGSSTASSQEFLDVIQPEYAIISCGEGNKYNHPHEETMERLQGIDATIYRTDVDGTIVATSNGVDITFTFENE
jgi:beta-lactamase superfamily II metal-dependent hydrolase